MASEAVIRSKLQAVADGQLGLWDFAEWIDSYSWNMHRDSQPGAIHIASQILHRFAEYDIHGDESALHRELMSLVGDKQIIVRFEIDAEQRVTMRNVLNLFGSANSAAAFPQPFAA